MSVYNEENKMQHKTPIVDCKRRLSPRDSSLSEKALTSLRYCYIFNSLLKFLVLNDIKCHFKTLMQII